MIEFVFILVESEEEGNLGAAARALNTMGHRDLRLVRPMADHLSGFAQAMAHGSQHILESATVYEELADALQDIDFACATTARHRQQKYHYVSVRDLPELLSDRGQINRVALVFGGERSGLNAKDIDQCDLVTTIPQKGLYPSLNLAQAVMVYSFMLSEALTDVHIKDQRLQSQAMPVQQYASLKSTSLKLMDRIGLSDKYKTYVIQGLARLGYEDLYLLHNIRAQIDKALDRLEKLHQ